jgi:hypothetical protein
LSLGRYGADEGARKVSLEITVDKWISDALDKIRTKRSVSNLVNGLLAIVIRQFDPGPSSPLIYALDRLLTEYKEKAEASGDTEMIASVVFLRSRLEPYFDLAEVVLDREKATHGTSGDDGVRAQEGISRFATSDSYSGLLFEKETSGRDYHWYAVPMICHGTPMTYLRNLNAWKCSTCGSIYPDN